MPRTASEVRGRLLTVETHDDRTLFFDLLPVFFHTKGGFKVKVKLFTVPGQVIHNATRRVVLQGADAVAFIADSRRSAGAGEQRSTGRTSRRTCARTGSTRRRSRS